MLSIALFGIALLGQLEFMPSDEAYNIFSKSRDVIRKVAPPTFVSYAVRVSVRSGNIWKTRTYATT